MTHWQQHSNILHYLAEVGSYKQVQGLSVGVNFQGLHGYESPHLLENRAEVPGGRQLQTSSVIICWSQPSGSSQMGLTIP